MAVKKEPLAVARRAEQGDGKVKNRHDMHECVYLME